MLVSQVVLGFAVRFLCLLFRLFASCLGFDVVIVVLLVVCAYVCFTQ